MAGVPAVRLEHRVNGTWFDVTSRLLWGDNPVSMNRGTAEDGGVTIGTAVFTLDNSDGALTPRHPSSPHFPHLTRYRPVRFSVRIGGTYRPRFYGYIDSEPVTFGNEPATDCRVTWSAIDHFGMAALKPLRSVAVETLAASNPLALYPLTDSQAASVPDQSAYTRPSLVAKQWGTGGEAGWSSGLILATDIGGGLVLTPATDNGVYLRSDTGIDLPASWSLSVWIDPAAKDGYVCQIGTDSYSVGIWYDTSAKKLSAIETLLDSGGDPIDYVMSTTTSTWTPGFETLTVTPTGIKLGSSSTTGTRHTSDQMLGSLVSVGSAMAVESGRARMYSGEVKHLAIWSGTVPAGVLSDAVSGPSSMGMMSTAIQQLLSWAGLTVTVDTLGSDRAVQLVKTDSTTAMDVISTFARGSLARIWCDGDGTVDVASFDWTSTPTTAPAGAINLAIEWAADPDGDITDATMTWPDGGSYNATEPATYRSSIDLPGVLPVPVGSSVADWVVSSSLGEPSFPSAMFDLLTIPDADLPALAIVSLASKLAIPGLPAQLPTSTQTGLVRSISETVGAAVWQIQLSIESDSRDRLFIVGDAVRGVVGNGYLAAPLGSSVGTTSWKAGDPVTAAKLNSSGYSGPAMQAGSVVVTPVANTVVSVNVNFPAAFSVAPTVVAEISDSAVNNITVAVSAATTTGFTLYVRRNNTTLTTVNWMATT